MEARTPTRSRRQNEAKNVRGAVENTLRWFARIGAAFNKPTRYLSRLRPASHITSESRTESAAEEARVIAAANESATIQPTNGGSFPAPVSADAKSRIRPALHTAAESRTESAREEARVIAAANESATIQPTNGASFPAPVSADAKVERDAQVNHVPPILPDQHEIQRRRDLIRTLFNDFWDGASDKPRAFVERLDQAETYLNERLTVLGEFWQLDTNTRVMLGLPPRST